ncbi:MAG: Verru_Chthon cassette protein A, partial [Rhodospirillales bacterium]|nr:Verru_Chthon cassette protein A [Acetobacter sp.]
MPIPLLFKPSHRQGFALVVVMLSLTLITALTIFFLSDVGRERRSIDQYSHSGDARHLSDTAVNLVMAQINAATKEGTAAAPVSWASQPGMIRTYGTNGNLSNAYKLYSWDNLIEGPASGVAFDPNASTELPDSNWNQRPSQFTDLNAPINGVYPIADPSIANATADPLNDTATTGTPLVSGSAVPPWDFPEAFSVVKDAARGYYSSSNPLPMPVKWIYVLQDGTWVTPASATNTAATFSGGAAGQTPSSTNPIVGRVAFWTDDETSKVNINTASEGNFWDTPKAATQDDLQFAANPPAKNEFQRISGHPATTSLSAVFPEMRLNGFSRWTAGGSGPNTTHQTEMQGLLDLTPRISWTNSTLAAAGGSQFGTWPLTSYTATYAPAATNSYGSVAIGLDSNRLYATADDLWFQPDRTSNSGFGRAPTTLTASQIAKRLFLYTADSRAPETTLFETPRISLWPITWPNASTVYYNTNGYYLQNGSLVATVRTTPAASTSTPDPANLAGNPWMTYQERLLAFDSTINTNGPNATPAVSPLPYYFQRQYPDSPTYDWTRFQRNQDLVGYLSREMRQPIPGAGSSLALDDASHWGTANGDWIALNCLDFSRSLINQYTYNQTSSGTGNTAGSDYLYAYTGVQMGNGRLDNVVAPHGEPNAY